MQSSNLVTSAILRAFAKPIADATASRNAYRGPSFGRLLIGFLVVAIALLQAVAVTEAAEKTFYMKQRFYWAGANFGITSYFASILRVMPETRTKEIVIAAQNGLVNVNTDLRALAQASDSGFYDLDPTIQKVADLAVAYSDMALRVQGIGHVTPDSPYADASFDKLYKQVVGVRDELTGHLSTRSKPVTDMYVLGVHIGIARGHASGGDGGRQVVHDALVNAKAAARELHFDTAELDACIATSLSTTPMPELLRRVIAIQQYYQTQIERWQG